MDLFGDSQTDLFGDRTHTRKTGLFGDDDDGVGFVSNTQSNNLFGGFDDNDDDAKDTSIDMNEKKNGNDDFDLFGDESVEIEPEKKETQIKEPDNKKSNIEESNILEKPKEDTWFKNNLFGDFTPVTLKSEPLTGDGEQKNPPNSANDQISSSKEITSSDVIEDSKQEQYTGIDESEKDQLTLMSTLENLASRRSFTKFLKSQNCEETISFCDEVDQFKYKINDKNLLKNAQEITSKYINVANTTQTPREHSNILSFNAENRKKIQNRVEKGSVTRDLFDEAQEEVYTMMKSPFENWKGSEYCDKYLKEKPKIVIFEPYLQFGFAFVELYITSITEGSQADKAGLFPGLRIVAVNDIECVTSSKIKQLISLAKLSGKNIEMTFSDTQLPHQYMYETKIDGIEDMQFTELNLKEKPDYGEIKIHIAEFKSEGNFYTYPISTALVKKGSVYRRFSDFQWLRAWLVSVFPGVFVPLVYAGNLMTIIGTAVTSADNNLLKERQCSLQKFLNEIANHEVFGSLNVLHVFLSLTGDTFDTSLREFNEFVTRRKIQDICTDLNNWYPNVPIADKLTEDEEKKIRKLLESMSTLSIKLEGIVYASRNLVASTSNMLSCLEKQNECLEQVTKMDFSQWFPGNFEPAPDIQEDLTEWNIHLKSKSELYDVCLRQSFNDDLLKVWALLEMLNSWEHVADSLKESSLVSDVQNITLAGVVKKSNRFWGAHLATVKGLTARTMTASPSSDETRAKRHAFQKIQDGWSREDRTQLMHLLGQMILKSQYEIFRECQIQNFRKNFLSLSQSQYQVAKQMDKVWKKMIKVTNE